MGPQNPGPGRPDPNSEVDSKPCNIGIRDQVLGPLGPGVWARDAAAKKLSWRLTRVMMEQRAECQGLGTPDSRLWPPRPKT